MGCSRRSCGHDLHVDLRQLYGGSARRRTVAVALASAVGGVVTGVAIGGLDTAGASLPSPTPPHEQLQKVRHTNSPTPFYVVPLPVSRTPSKTPSPSVTATPSA